MQIANYMAQMFYYMILQKKVLHITFTVWLAAEYVGL